MKVLCTILMLFLFAQINAQNRVITGTVTDQNGGPIPNATVVAKGTKVGVATSVNGRFTLSVPSTVNTLVVSSVNFVTKEVDITASSTVTINLQPSTGNLSEVVVV